MNRLQSLSKHLLKHTSLKREQIHSYADNGELRPLFMDWGNGFTVGRYKYDAVFELERFKGNAFELLALINCWLDENDGEREQLELADPEINVELNDRHTCDIELVIEFDEAVSIVEDPKGSIPFRGQRYRVENVPVDIAEAFQMEGETDVR
ncbi:phage tail protein [Endozoicomonas sp. YOMI1]|uniref:phage tail protein n=1 Tax=Endozoicomonas sp. YOMI1 TaxID=2828739 RepID=UPI0021495A1A|nr:phage tail protein [Endozoicomonas sp. YOMI1]